MTMPIEQFVEGWLFDPTVGKLVSASVGILLVMALVRISRGLLNRYVQEPGNLYRVKKMVTFLGYFTGIVIISLIFSDRLGKMAVAFGVAGAGIAFALQEIIASLAGWVAISFGNFYNTGDRVQLVA
ncbi:MAG: mechanosensitive ion channel [Nitrospiraceae bacterium]|nr:mechanosensitive ion channel [Nitrospiraceae bacterium]